MSSPDPHRDPEQAPTAGPATTSAQGPESGSRTATDGQEGSAGSAAKRRRRRRSRRGRRPAAPIDGQGGDQAGGQADDQGSEQGGGGEPPGADGAAGKPKKRRRRGRRSRSGGAATATGAGHPATDAGADTASTAATPDPAAAGGAASAPPSPAGGRRKKRRRRGSGSGSGSVAVAVEEQPALIRGRRRTRSGRIEEVSAGGLVVDATGDVVRGVLIGKHDRKGRLVWSLPKGHVEAGETLEQTAVRETEEETGVTAEVRQKLGEVDYWFMLHGEKIHKTVHHFLLRFVSGELCDRDVEVAEVAWVPLAEIPAKLAYPDERRLVARVPELLPRAM
jgi:ADP-ribose pyrophosphatase YjhB (NUDIX family)